MKYTIKSPPSVYREDNYKTKKQTEMQFKKKITEKCEQAIQPSESQIDNRGWIYVPLQVKGKVEF